MCGGAVRGSGSALHSLSVWHSLDLVSPGSSKARVTNRKERGLSRPIGSNVLKVSGSQLHLGHGGDGGRWEQPLVGLSILTKHVVNVHPVGC